VSFWDTSALANLYVPEFDSSDFAWIAGAMGALVVAAITPYEARTVFRRREQEGMIPAGGAIELRPLRMLRILRLLCGSSS